MVPPMAKRRRPPKPARREHAAEPDTPMMEEESPMAPDAPENETVAIEKDMFVWYVREGEGAARPAKVISDGIVESVRKPSGMEQYATIQYGTLNETHVLLGHESPKPAPGDHDDKARAVSERMMHETTAPWNGTGAPNTW